MYNFIYCKIYCKSKKGEKTHSEGVVVGLAPGLQLGCQTADRRLMADEVIVVLIAPPPPHTHTHTHTPGGKVCTVMCLVPPQHHTYTIVQPYRAHWDGAVSHVVCVCVCACGPPVYNSFFFTFWGGCRPTGKTTVSETTTQLSNVNIVSVRGHMFSFSVPEASPPPPPPWSASRRKLHHYNHRL